MHTHQVGNETPAHILAPRVSATSATAFGFRPDRLAVLVLEGMVVTSTNASKAILLWMDKILHHRRNPGMMIPL